MSEANEADRSAAASTPSRSGGCLCGAVRYVVSGPLRPVVGCHCRQCRRTSGHHVAATAAARAHLSWTGDDALTWYESSPGVRRAFCGVCGSNLFWDVGGAPVVSIFAGTLDDATGLRLVGHIFCADKGEYYDIPAQEDAPTYAQDWLGPDPWPEGPKTL